MVVLVQFKRDNVNTNLAMDTLKLSSANDTVPDSSTILQDEYSIFATRVALGAGHTTIELLITEVNGGTAGNGTSSVEDVDSVDSPEGARRWKTSDRAFLGGEVEALSGGEAKSEGKSEGLHLERV